MERVSYLRESHFRDWEKLTAGRRWLDRFCSSGYWGEPLHDAFQPFTKLVCYRASRSDSMAVFAERTVPGGRLLLPADAMWLLGSPLLGPSPDGLLEELVGYWRSHPLREGVRQIVISGLYPNHPLLASSTWARLGGWEIEPSGRMVASLEGGLDGFMSRRSKNFRSRLRRTVKAARGGGVEVELFPHRLDRQATDRITERIFGLEKRSWKGRAERGIDQGGMRRFYELMTPLLADQGRLRGLFLRRDDADVAYLFGGLYDGYFRGLQFSYSAEETLGLGNVCQYHMIRALVEEGCSHYDLGQAMEYKRRWAEAEVVSRSFVFQL